MKIIKSFCTKNDCYWANEHLNALGDSAWELRIKQYRKAGKPKGLMIHSIGCPQPRGDVFATGWNIPNKPVLCHGFIDGNTGDVWQFLPWDYAGWHSGAAANGTHIGVEMGEPDCIKYKPSSASFTVQPGMLEKAKTVADRTYHSAVELFAELCRQYGLDPLADGVVISHSEGFKRGVASNHGDPEHIWKQLGLPYTMDTFRRDIKAAMAGECEQYTVMPGDTLWGIAKRKLGAGKRYIDIMTLNGLKNDSVWVGMLLKIPRK